MTPFGPSFLFFFPPFFSCVFVFFLCFFQFFIIFIHFSLFLNFFILFFLHSPLKIFFKEAACSSVFAQASFHNVMGNMGGWDIIIHLKLFAPSASLGRTEHPPEPQIKPPHLWGFSRPSNQTSPAVRRPTETPKVGISRVGVKAFRPATPSHKHGRERGEGQQITRSVFLE